MDRVNWGVISTSNFAVEISVPAMMAGKNVHVSAIAGRDPAKARRAAERLGIPTAYGSYDAILNDPQIEAVYIPLPNHLHVPWAAKAAEAGKHVLCEKPLAMDAQEAESLIGVRDRTGKLIQEAYMVLTHPQILRARQLIAEGHIGTVRAIQGFLSWTITDPQNIRHKPETGGGIVYDGGGYAIATSRFLFESEPRRVVALLDFHPTYKVDRLASVILDFSDGQASFVVSQELVDYERTQIVGTKGRIEIQIPYNPPADKPCRLFIDDGSSNDGSSIVTETLDVVDQYTLEAELFSEAIRTGRPQPIPLEYSVGNMRVMDAVFRSAKSGRWKPYSFEPKGS